MIRRMALEKQSPIKVGKGLNKPQVLQSWERSCTQLHVDKLPYSHHPLLTTLLSPPYSHHPTLTTLLFLVLVLSDINVYRSVAQLHHDAAALLGAVALHGSASAIDLLSGTHARRVAITPVDVHQELSSQLSNSNISKYYLNDPQFRNLTDRWSDFTEGSIIVVWQPADTHGVAQSVKFANGVDFPFLAVNGGGHGLTASLNAIWHGLSINLNKLNKIQISTDGKSALIGGGVNTHQVVNTLAASGKVTGKEIFNGYLPSTTNVGCTGHIGPALGGGFGRYQGYFGLALDNIIDMTVVFANGSIANVSSTSNPDLYWGMRGAGHNFGIVTEANIKIYDPPTRYWFRTEFIFEGTQLERVFEHINDFDQPKEYGYILAQFAMNPQYSKTDPVIVLQLDYAADSQESADRANDYFLRLHHIAVRHWGFLSPTEIQPAVGQDIGMDIWYVKPLDRPLRHAHGDRSRRLFPLGLKSYNVTANRQVYDLFKQLVTEHPEFNGSVTHFEGFALQGMQAVDPDSTAYPHRDDNFLVSLLAIYKRYEDSDAIAALFGNRMRDIWHAGDTPGRNVTAYVNYAAGDESLEAKYGYESWRLDRLRALKKTYDPEHKFRFYNDIY
ncbi:MAG: hypothetical protein L6R40_003494 [Gallowayella cf. fulva]|nr:MAG: hypothetical protein L6R40_003494 [Xanthomendoza cf. fulva]